MISDQWEEKAEAARQAAEGLPRAEVVDKILRYERQLERQFHRAMQQLGRLQEKRLREGRGGKR